MPSITTRVLLTIGMVLFISIVAFTTLSNCERKQPSEVSIDSSTEPESKQTRDNENPVSSQVSQTPLPPDAPSESEPLERIPREYTFSEKLAQAALERTTHQVRYDGRYLKIGYPMGDVPDGIGVCTDVVIRSYRELGVDLQQLVHEDIRQHFNRYPNHKRWGLSRPDANIDHRRVPNLRVFFERHGASLPVSDRAQDYVPGDIVTWKLNEKMVHIGIVAEERAYLNPSRHLIIHNIGRGPELGDMLFDYEITGHYRYSPDAPNDELEKGI